MKAALLLLSLCVLFTSVGNVSAAPPSWESDFGAVLDDLTGQDDAQASVTMSFPFPFEGTSYPTVFVGTNGGIQLGDLGDDNDINFEIWEIQDQFYDDGGSPLLLAFNTDLDLSVNGSIHFKDYGDRAVFTWNEVGTHEKYGHLSSFQMQLFPDGRIYFSYNGILDGRREDLVHSLAEGILVGISGSTGTNPGAVDLSTPVSTSTDTLYEVWNDENAPDNSLFDLDMETLVFAPRAGGGFSASLLTPGLALPDLLIGKKATLLSGDGIRDPRRPTRRQTIFHSGRLSSNKAATAYLDLQNDGESEGTFTLKTFGARLPRLTVSAWVSGNVGNIGAAMESGRFKPAIAAGESVRVVYHFRSGRLDAGNGRSRKRNGTIRFQLSGLGVTDNAAMTTTFR